MSVITTSYEKRVLFKKINFISINYNFIKKLSRKLKFLIALFLLMKELCNNKQNIVFSFQANVYCVYLCKIMNSKVIVRSNSSPTGWSKNIFKRIVYKNALSLSDEVIVNSYEFKRLIKKNLMSNLTASTILLIKMKF